MQCYAVLRLLDFTLPYLTFPVMLNNCSLTLDFDVNKKIAEEVAIIPSKRLRNKIAGFVTHLMKRIARGGSVRGISLKLQEEERERRLDFIPERSVLDQDNIDIDPDTGDLLKSLKFQDIAGVTVTSQVEQPYRRVRPQRHGTPPDRQAKSTQ
jgi:small subunit ribosomal protein S17e